MKLPKFLRSNKTLLYGALVIGGGVVLYMVARGQGNGTTSGSQYVTAQNTGPSEALQIAGIQSQTQLALAQTQMQGNLALAQFQGELEAALATRAMDTELALAGVDANLRGDEIEAQLAGLNAQLDQQAYIAATQAQSEQARYESERMVREAELEANASMFNQSINAQLQTSAMQTEALMFQTATQAQMFQDQIAANVISDQYDRDVDIARVHADIIEAEEDAKTERARISAGNSAHKRSNNSSMLGTIAGAALTAFSLFSDTRLKSDIERVGETPEGVPTYRYKIGGQTQYGVLAQELMDHNPDAVIDTGGPLMVDYSRVA